MKEAALAATGNDHCELREPSAASGGCSEAEAQRAREIKEAALAATRNDHCELRELGPSKKQRGGAEPSALALWAKCGAEREVHSHGWWKIPAFQGGGGWARKRPERAGSGAFGPGSYSFVWLTGRQTPPSPPRGRPGLAERPAWPGAKAIPSRGNLGSMGIPLAQRHATPARLCLRQGGDGPGPRPPPQTASPPHCRARP